MEDLISSSSEVMTLQKISLIQLAINFWEDKSIKDEIKIVFSTNKLTEITENEQREKIKWINKIIKKINPMDLTDTIKDYLIFITRQIGEQLIAWLKMIIKKLCRFENSYPTIVDYLDNVQWTSYGTINEIKTFELLCIEAKRNDTINIIYMFEEACLFCLEDFIKLLWKNFSIEKRDAWLNIQINDCYTIHIFIYWRCWLLNESSSNYLSINYKNTNGFEYSAEENAFRSSALNGNNIAAKYFFEKLNNNEKNRVLIETSQLLTQEFSMESWEFQLINDDSKICGQKNIDLLDFLMTKMSDIVLYDFLKEHKFRVLCMLTECWQYHNLFFKMLNFNWQFIRYSHYRYLYQKMIEIVVQEFQYFGIIQGNSLRLLHEFWKISPLRLKNCIVEKFWTMSTKIILTFQDISYLSFIIDDQDMLQQRKKLIDNFKNCGDNLILKKQYQVLNSFIGKLLDSDEKSLVKCQLLKSKYSFNFFILNNRYDDADEFINWKFNSINDRINFKNSFKNDFIFTFKSICLIWEKSTLDNVESNLNNYFNWLSYTKDEIFEIKKEMKNTNFVILQVQKLAKERPDDKYYEKCLDYFDFKSFEILEISREDINDEISLKSFDSSGGRKLGLCHRLLKQFKSRFMDLLFHKRQDK